MPSADSTAPPRLRLCAESARCVTLVPLGKVAQRATAPLDEAAAPSAVGADADADADAASEAPATASEAAAAEAAAIIGAYELCSGVPASLQHERDAEAAAHVRYADADRMRLVLTQRSPTPLRAISWHELARRASVIETRLLGAAGIGAESPIRVLARPFLHHDRVQTDGASPAGVDSQRGTDVLTLGVHSRYAAIACGTSNLDANDAKHGDLVVWTCPVSYAADIDWTKTDLVFDADAELHASTLHAAEMLIVTDCQAIVYELPSCERISFRAFDFSPRSQRDADAAGIAWSGATSACALSATHVAIVSSRRLDVYVREDQKTLGASDLALRVTAEARALAASSMLGTHGFTRSCTYDHDRNMTSVAFSADGSKMLVGDEAGLLLAFRLDTGAPLCEATPPASNTASSAAFAAPFTIDLADARARPTTSRRLAVRTLNFEGSRIVSASSEGLVLVDRDPARFALRAGLDAARGRALEHRLGSAAPADRDAPPIASPISVAFWGDALVVHHADNTLLVYDYATGAVVNAFMGPKMREGIPLPQSNYQSLFVSDQTALLLPNGTLLYLDVV